MKAILVAALFGLASLPALAKDQRVPVEVLSAQSQQHEGVRHVRGSPGTTDTRCHVNGDYANCTSTTTGQSEGYDRVVSRTEVTVMLKMPDGSRVNAHCQNNSLFSVCLEPPVGPYQAYVHGHDVHLLVPLTGSPKYNKDGTIKKAGKTTWAEVRFSW